MNPDELRAKIRDAASEGRMPCAAAFRLAEELGISRRDLGNLLDELKIKITQCQLGCF